VKQNRHFTTAEWYEMSLSTNNEQKHM